MRLDAGPGDTVLIVDGLWHQSAPVRHREILALLARGVAVVGAASMVALRAAELAPYGMVGVGRIFEDYRSGVLDADDEVVVLHTDDGRPLSEALVNLRAALTRAAADGQLHTTEAGTSSTWDAPSPTQAGRGPNCGDSLPAKAWRARSFGRRHGAARIPATPSGRTPSRP